LRYALSLLACAATFVLVRYAMPSIARNAPLASVMTVVIAAAYLAGPGPARACLALGAIVGNWGYFNRGTFLLSNTAEDNVRLLALLLIAGLITVISARWRRGNEVLRDREQKLRILLEKMPVVLWSTDLA